MMVFLSAAIFIFSTWCVLSRHFADGIIAKNFLSMSAILSFLVVLDSHNVRAALSSGILLIIGLLYAYYRPTRRRPLFTDRRERQRPF